MGLQFIPRAATAASFVVLTTAASTLTGAQAVLRGILYDDATGARVRGTVMLVDPATDAAVVHVATDSLGQFSIEMPSGKYQIAAVRPGYTSVLSAPVQFANGERLTIRLPIAENGDPQHHIGVLEHVKADGRVRTAENQDDLAKPGFQDRKKVGLGHRYERGEIEKANVHTLGEFLQGVPGLSVRNPNSTASMQATRGGSSLLGSARVTPVCRLGWFVDGHRMDMPGRADPITDGLGSMSLDAVSAIEVFRGVSEMPAEFAAPDLRCGAIAVWTKRGP